MNVAAPAASVSLTTIQLSRDQYDMEQTAIAVAVSGATEEYMLGWQWGTNHDASFGDVEARTDGLT